MSVQFMNSCSTRDTFMQDCLREICFLAAKREFEIGGQFIPGVENRYPDMLSRWELDTHYRHLFYSQTEGMAYDYCFIIMTVN